ncbi:MAG: type I methionyl aminopeptidase [candidate division WOR-3 bacterium]
MITIKTEEEIGYIRTAGKIIYEFLREVQKLIKPGVDSTEIEAFAVEFVRSRGGELSFKNYNGFPAYICFSINDEIVHGVPTRGKKVPESGLVKIDIGVKYKNYFADGAWTYIVGNVPFKVQKLVEITKLALYKGIEKAIEGNKLSDISKAIENTVKPYGFGIPRNLVGHGVGYNVHELPHIHNFYNPSDDEIILKEGMVLAIEPMITLKSNKTIDGKDGFTVKTADGSLSAHFEHTIVVRKGKAEILTQVDDYSWF